MKGTLLKLAVAAAVLGAGGWSLTENRSVGEIVVCQACSKILRHDIHLQRVPVWTGSRVQTKTVFCDRCSQQTVSYTISKKCLNCGKVYSATTASALRTERKQDIVLAEGFCCEEHAQRTVTVTQTCAWCGKVYYRTSKEVDFNAPEHDRSSTQGFCSAACQTLAAAQPATNKGGVVTLPPTAPAHAGAEAAARPPAASNTPNQQNPDGSNPEDTSDDAKKKQSSNAKTTGDAMTKGLEILQKFLQSPESKDNTAHSQKRR